jgi:hypothetical protein
MDDEGLADAAAANPFALPRPHPGIGSASDRCRSDSRAAALGHVRGSPLYFTGTVSGDASGPIWNRMNFSRAELLEFFMIIALPGS